METQKDSSRPLAVGLLVLGALIREFDDALLRDLPASTGPCGENGEFHSYSYAGPMFAAPIAIETGQAHRAGDFLYTDLLCPVSSR